MVKSPSKFAWTAFDVPVQDTITEGADPNGARERLAAGLTDHQRAVLFLESPSKTRQGLHRVSLTDQF